MRVFIQRYSLEDEQQQKAYEVLRQCEDKAKAYLDGHRERLTQLFPVTDSAASRPNEPNSELERQRNEFLNPIEEIFEDELKPKLERLPTRAQRAADEVAEKAVATQPSSRLKGSQP